MTLIIHARPVEFFTWSMWMHELDIDITFIMVHLLHQSKCSLPSNTVSLVLDINRYCFLKYNIFSTNVLDFENRKSFVSWLQILCSYVCPRKTYASTYAEVNSWRKRTGVQTNVGGSPIAYISLNQTSSYFLSICNTMYWKNYLQLNVNRFRPY